VRRGIKCVFVLFAGGNEASNVACRYGLCDSRFVVQAEFLAREPIERYCEEREV